MGYIYKIEGPINLPNENKIYVGQTIIPLNQRWGNHKVAFKHFAAKTPNMSFCNKLCRAVMKYNVENFKISLVEKCNDDILNDKEIYWIKELNTIYPNGYNVQFGGRSTVQNERTKKKIAKGLLKSISNKNNFNIFDKYISIHYNKYNNVITSHGYKVSYFSANVKKCLPSVRINEPLTEFMLKEAKDYLVEVINNHIETLSDSSDSGSDFEAIPFEYIRNQDKIKYINSWTNARDGKIATLHGYIVRYLPLGKTKIISIDVNKDITSEMLELAKEYKQQFIDEHNNIMLEKQFKNLKI